MTNIKMKVGEIHSKLILDKDNDALIAFHQQGKNSQFLLKTTLYFAKEKNADALYHFANCFWCGTLSISAIFSIGNYEIIEKLYKNNKISAEEFALSLLVGEKDKLLLKYANEATREDDKEVFASATTLTGR